MKKASITFTVAFIVLVVLALGALYFRLHWLSQAGLPIKYDATNTPTAILSRFNHDYQLARQYQSRRDYTTALSYYKKALAAAQDKTQEGQIEFNIAYMTELIEGPVAAIPQFKAIAADTGYGPSVRAYSIQEIGLMYHVYYENRSAIISETYKDMPYAAFYQKGDAEMANRKLFEYAASMYPLAASEGYIANWYARDLLITQQGATTTPAGLADVRNIQRAVTLAESNIENVKNDPSQIGYLGYGLTQIGVSEAALASTDAIPDFSKADSAFRQSLQIGTATGQPLGNFYVFHYAAFFATYYGRDRTNSIRTLLAPFTSANVSNIMPEIVTFFRTAHTDQSLAIERRELIRLGQIDPDFATYLESLGWNEKDFTSLN